MSSTKEESPNLVMYIYSDANATYTIMVKKILVNLILNLMKVYFYDIQIEVKHIEYLIREDAL